MQIRLVLVEPRYQINIGYAARVAMNFGVSEIVIVNPKCNYKGLNAIKYSKHARGLLENAKISKSIELATKNSVVIGTTGISSKARGFYNVYRIEKISAKIRKMDKISLLIGREGTGLSIDELKRCTATIFIPANSEYNILNTSHALAIILYELTRKRFERSLGNIYAGTDEMRGFMVLFKRYLKKSAYIRDKDSVGRAMDNIIKRSYPTKREITTLMAAFHDEK